MGDMGNMFNEQRAAKKERREVAASLNTGLLFRMGIKATEQSKNVFRIETEDGAVMYYPSSSKWQLKGRVFNGDVANLVKWLRDRHYI